MESTHVYSCPVFERTYVTTQKNVKVMFFWILKKNVKNVKNARIDLQAT